MQDLNVTIIQTDLAWHDAAKNCSRLDGIISAISEDSPGRGG